MKNFQESKGKEMTKVVISIMIFASLLFSLIIAQLIIVKADPDGADVVYITNSSKVAKTPDNRTDAKGTITTIFLNTVQQNIRWKAYVGNVSGKLVLRDAEQYSIYEWPAMANPDGVIFITMNQSIDWTTIQCANTSDIQNFQLSLGHSNSALDNVNNTFNTKIHQSFDVGVKPFSSNQCWSAFPWVNNSAQTPSTNALFQEVLLMDANRRIIFASLIDQDTQSYRNDGTTKYDFQALVPDYTSAENALYYFYVEISG
ncbi:MAG: hypothetical protein QW757_03200 [Candidatus Woesearchaeota archaeon]